VGEVEAAGVVADASVPVVVDEDVVQAERRRTNRSRKMPMIDLEIEV
jgi:hypothetical protein